MVEQLKTKCPHCGYPVEIGEHASDCPNKKEKAVEEPVVTTEEQADEPNSGSTLSQDKKSPQQLEQQFRFSEAYKMTRGESDSELSPEPEAELFQLDQNELKKRLAENPGLQAQYVEYVKNLRGLRKSERWKLMTYNVENKSNTKDTAVIDRPPLDLMESILKSVQGSGSIGSERYFSDADLEEAKNDIDKFYSLLRMTVQERPDAFLRNIERIRSIFHDDEIKKIAQAAAERDPGGFLYYLDSFADIFTDDELNSVVRDVIEGDSNNYGIMEILKSDKIKSRLEKKIIIECIDNKKEKSLFPDINNFISGELISREDAISQFVKYVDGDKYFDKDDKIIQEYLGLFSSEDELNKLRASMDKRAGQGDLDTLLYPLEESLELYGAVLGDKWKNEVITRMVNDNPEEFLKNETVVEKNKNVVSMDAIVDRCIEKIRDNFNYQIVEKLLEYKDLTPEQRKIVGQQAVEGSPYLAFRHRNVVLETFPEEDRPRAMQQILEGYPEGIVNGSTELKKLSHLSESEQVQFGKGLLEDIEDFRFLDTYKSDGHEGEFLRRLIPESELKDFIIRKAELHPDNAIRSLKKIREALGNEEDLKELVKKLIGVNTYTALTEFSTYAYIFDKSEADELLDDLISRDPDSALTSIDRWSKAVPNEQMKEIADRFISMSPDMSLYHFEHLARFVDKNKMEEVVSKLIDENNFIAYSRFDVLRKFVPGLTKESILDGLEANEDYLQFAPKNLKELTKRLRRSKTIEQEETLVQQGFLVQRSINAIRREGYEQVLLKVIKKENPNERNEIKLLDNIHSLALIKKIGGIDVDIESLSSSQEVEEKLINETASILDIAGLSKEQHRQAIESFGGASSMLLYMSRHKDNPDIMDLLRKTYEKAGQGSYREWRFEQDRSLEEIIKDGRLPEKISQDQYDSWTKDDQTDMSAALETTSADVAMAIKTILHTNIQELGSEALQESDPEQTLEEIKKEIKNSGQEIASLSKQMKGASDADRELLLEKISEIKNYQARLSAERDILRLTLLKAEEVAQGYLHEGQEGKRSQKLSKFIKRLRGQFPEAGSIFDEIEKTLQGLGTGDQAAQNLVATDTADLETCFKIGAIPVHSCQDYNNGQYNEALLAYVAEANTKAAVVKNEKEKVIGRRITRLLGLRDGTPAIFLEDKYASTASGALDKVMLTHILNKAESNNIRVFIKDVEVVPDGFELQSSSEVLQSKGGRAPFVYVDAAGGERKRGKYRISGVKEIIRTGT